MGNAALAWKRRKLIKVIQLDGRILRLNPPATAGEVIRDHPGHSLLDSEEVKRLRTQAHALDLTHALEAGKLYFLVAIPHLPSIRHQRRISRRWSTGIHVTAGAAARLEGLKLSRRSASDVSLSMLEKATGEGNSVRVRIRLTKGQVADLLQEGGNSSEDAAEDLVMALLAKKMDLRASISTETCNSDKPNKRVTRFAPVYEN